MTIAIVEKLGNGGDVVRFTAPQNQVIPKHVLVKLVDPRTASGAWSITPSMIAGISAMEKVSGSTSVSVYTNVLADITAGSTVATGQDIIAAGTLSISGAKTNAAGAQSGAIIIGKAQEDATLAEVVLCQIKT